MTGFEPPLVYIARMPAAPTPAERSSNISRRLLLLLAAAFLAGIAYYVFGRDALSLEALLRHRDGIDAFVARHQVLAVLRLCRDLHRRGRAIGPGSGLSHRLRRLHVLTADRRIGCGPWRHHRCHAHLSCRAHGARRAAAAAGRPSRRQAGRGFSRRCLQLSVVSPAGAGVPFFLVNLVPAVAGVRLLPFVAATALGVIPGSAALPSPAPDSTASSSRRSGSTMPVSLRTVPIAGLPSTRRIF